MANEPLGKLSDDEEMLRPDNWGASRNWEERVTGRSIVVFDWDLWNDEVWFFFKDNPRGHTFMDWKRFQRDFRMLPEDEV